MELQVIKPVAQFQWMRQPSVQIFGAQEKVYLLTKTLWPSIELMVREYSANISLQELLKHRDVYVSLQRNFQNNAPPESVRVLAIEGPEAKTPRPGVAYFSLKVDSFESPEAKQWGSFDDEEVYGWKCSGPELRMWFNHVVGRIKKFDARKERAKIVGFLDGYAVALYTGYRQVGWLGKRGAITEEPPWIFVSRRIAERIATGCLYDVDKKS